MTNKLLGSFGDTMLMFMILSFPWFAVSILAYALIPSNAAGFFVFAFGWVLMIPWAHILNTIETKYGVYIVP